MVTETTGRYVGVGYFQANERMRELVNDVLDSGRLSYGPYSQAFEERMAFLHRNKFGVLSNSGTSALQVAVQALKEIHGWPDGAEVLVPSITFVATVNVLLHNRLKPVLVDVCQTTYNMNPDLLRDKLRQHKMTAVAVMPVHLFGMMADMKAISEIVQAHNDEMRPFNEGVKIIEDSCECMFATQNGLPSGYYGDITCFSTYVAHLITTGVGGLSITNNPQYAAKMRSLVNHGRDGIYISIDDDKDAEDLREVISRRFSFEAIGHSFRITEMEAALGVAQLETYEFMIARRQYNAMRLTELLSDLGDYLQLPTIPEDRTHSFMMYPIVYIDRDAQKKNGLTYYLEQHGIETRDMLPLINQPAYKGLDLWDAKGYPVAQWIDDRGFYIGCHQGLTDDDLEYISEVFHEYF